MAAGDVGSTSTPIPVSRTILAIPGRSAATTGTPAPIASNRRVGVVEPVVQRGRLDRDDRDVRRRGPGRDLVGSRRAEEVDAIGVGQGRRPGLDGRLRAALPDHDEMHVRQFADGDGGFVDPAVRDHGSEDQRDLGRRGQVEVEVEQPVGPCRRIERQRTVVDDRHRSPEAPLEMLGVGHVHGHDRIGGLGPPSLPAGQEPAPSLGQQGEAGTLEMDVRASRR